MRPSIEPDVCPLHANLFLLLFQGKTAIIQKILDALPLDASVLWPSGRRSFSYKIAQQFATRGVKCYLDMPKGMFDMTAHPRLVCQDESLVRIPNDHVFDCVITDELALNVAHAGARYEADSKAVARVAARDRQQPDSVVRHASPVPAASATPAQRPRWMAHNEAAWKGLCALGHFARTAKQRIWLDNDLTSAHVVACQKHVVPHSTRVNGISHLLLHNIHKPWRHQIEEARVCQGFDAHTRFEMKLLDELARNHALKQRGEPFCSVVVCDHSKEHLRTLKRMAVARGIPSELFVIYTSETDKARLREAVLDIENEWDGLLCVGFTSTLPR